MGEVELTAVGPPIDKRPIAIGNLDDDLSVAGSWLHHSDCQLVGFAVEQLRAEKAASFTWDAGITAIRVSPIAGPPAQRLPGSHPGSGTVKPDLLQPVEPEFEHMWQWLTRRQKEMQRPNRSGDSVFDVDHAPPSLPETEARASCTARHKIFRIANVSSTKRPSLNTPPGDGLNIDIKTTSHWSRTATALPDRWRIAASAERIMAERFFPEQLADDERTI